MGSTSVMRTSGGTHSDHLVASSSSGHPPLAFSTSTARFVDLAWSDFSGGQPFEAMTPTGLVGLELPFQCPVATDCRIDVTMGTTLLARPPVPLF